MIRPLQPVFLALAALILTTGAEAQPNGLSPEALAYRASLAAQYLVRAQRPDGTFAYEYDFPSGRFLRRDGSLGLSRRSAVRQAGTAFALAEYLNRTHDPSLRRPIERALGAFDAKSIRYVDGQVVSGDGTLAGARTGASALALLAELNYYEATGDDRFAPVRRLWLDALKALQLETGGFARTPGAQTESPYYNGESWLALAHYVRLFPTDTTARDMVARADAYMIDRYTQDPDVSFFHWGMLAASVRFKTTMDRRFLDFAFAQAGLFVLELRPEVRPNSNSCYSIEGLAAGAYAMEIGGLASGPAYDTIVDRVERELNKSFTMQIMPNQTQIALAADRYLVDGSLDKFVGAFLNGRYRPQTRIDFTQHCLSAIMQYSGLTRRTGIGE